jgi:hypothetical protein
VTGSYSKKLICNYLRKNFSVKFNFGPKIIDFKQKFVILIYMKFQIFHVTGSGFFPLDMLRYDSCYPHSQEDVSKISSLGKSSEDLGQRTITLARRVKSRIDQPRIDRWASFGWTVEKSITY